MEWGRILTTALAMYLAMTYRVITCDQVDIVIAEQNGNIYTVDLIKAKDGYQVFGVDETMTTSNITEIYYDQFSEKFYIVDIHTRTIKDLKYSGNLSRDPTKMTSVLIKFSVGPSQVTIDYLHGNFYWTDRGLRRILMRSLLHEEIHTKTVAEDIEGLNGIACFPEKGQLFWIQKSSAHSVIKMADLIGGSPETFVQLGVHQPVDLEVDTVGKMLFWIDGWINTLNYITLSASHGRGVVPIGNFKGLSGLAIISSGQLVIHNTKEVRMVFYNGKQTNFQDIYEANQTITSLAVRSKNRSSSDVCKNLNCQQFCLQENGVTGCGCEDGFVLHVNGKTCLGIEDYLYNAVFFVLDGKVCSANIEYVIGEPANLSCVDHFDNVVHIVVDVPKRRLYLTTYDVRYKIVSYDIDHRKTTTLYETNEEITAMSYSFVEETLFWAQSGKMFRYFCVSKDISVIISNLGRVPEIVTDPHQKLLMWIDSDKLQIKSSSTDGHSRKTLVSSTEAKHLAYDGNYKRIYWTTGKRIINTNQNGLDFKISPKFPYSISELSILKGILYWMSFKNQSLSTTVYFTTTTEESDNVIQSTEIKGQVTDSVIFYRSLHRNSQDICDHNDRCEHLCWASSTSVNSSFYECKCYPGFKRGVDGSSCKIKTLTDNFFILSDPFSYYVYQVDVNTGSLSIVPTTRPVLNVKLDSEMKSIVAACKNHSIEIFNFGDKSTKVYYFESLQPTHAILDVEENSVLFIASNSTSSNLFGIRREGNYSATLLRENYEHVVDMVLHKRKRYLYVSFGGDNSSIVLSNLSSNEDKILDSPFPVKPTGIALDEKDGHLYIADSGKEHILRTTLTGDLWTFVYEDTGAMLIDIALSGDFLYILALNRRWLKKINKEGKQVGEVNIPMYLGNVHALEFFNDDKKKEVILSREMANAASKSDKDVILGLSIGFPLVIVAIILSFTAVILQMRRQLKERSHYHVTKRSESGHADELDDLDPHYNEPTDNF